MRMGENNVRYLNYEKDVKHFFYNEKKCFCYGAGMLGERFLFYCKKKKIKITAFIVSDNQNYQENAKLHGVPILLLSKALEKYSINKLIVAVDRRYVLEVSKNIKGKIPPNSIRYLPQSPYFIYEAFKSEFINEINKRKKLSLFEFKKLAAPLKMITFEKMPWNSFYGHDQLLRHLFNFSSYKSLPCTIEHGTDPHGLLISRYEFDNENRYGNVVYVANEDRRQETMKCLPEKLVYNIGLYIQYVEGIMEREKFYRLKEKLKKTLVVFPYHSDAYYESKYNEDVFLDEIEKISNDYDSTIICMYWLDILNGKYTVYKKRGYKIVTAGCIYDSFFLNRLRCIIELADMTMSNALGSHLGYCVCLNKPHYLFKQDIAFKSSSYKNEDLIEQVQKESLNNYDTEYMNKCINLTKKSFGVYKKKLDKKDKEVVRKYWGEWDDEIVKRHSY